LLPYHISSPTPESFPHHQILPPSTTLPFNIQQVNNFSHLSRSVIHLWDSPSGVDLFFHCPTFSLTSRSFLHYQTLPPSSTFNNPTTCPIQQEASFIFGFHLLMLIYYLTITFHLQHQGASQITNLYTFTPPTSSSI
jgi:hypothetical protein